MYFRFLANKVIYFLYIYDLLVFEFAMYSSANLVRPFLFSARYITTYLTYFLYNTAQYAEVIYCRVRRMDYQSQQFDRTRYTKHVLILE